MVVDIAAEVPARIAIARDDERIRLVVGFDVFLEERRDAYRICLAFNAEGAVFKGDASSCSPPSFHIPLRAEDVAVTAVFEFSAQGLAHPTASISQFRDRRIVHIEPFFQTSSVFAPTAGSIWVRAAVKPQWACGQHDLPISG